MNGLRRNALRFPLSTRVLCRFVAERVKDFQFTSLSLLFNVQTDFHVDSYNSPDDDNCVLKISSFEQGGVWVEHPQGHEFRSIRGERVPGRVMSFDQGFIRFNARQLRHATEKWKGDRLVIVAFTVNQPSSLAPHDLSCASALGFPVSLAQPQVTFEAGFQPEPMPRRPSALEVFSGSASLSRELAASGFQVLAFDRDTTKARAATLKVDLQDDVGQNLFWSIWADVDADYVHLGPPCGTASRARERPLSSRLKASGVPQPPPLRSEAFPFGIPAMLTSKAHGPRLRAANRLYRFTAACLLACLQEGRAFTLENPANSHFWAVLERLVLEWPEPLQVSFARLIKVDFAQCMHGGTRPKISRFLTNIPAVRALACRCDGQHKHDPWGAQWTPNGWRFATHLEAQYPRLLCRRVVEHVCSHLPAPKVLALAPTVSLHVDAMASLAVQSRRFPPLVSEFKQVVHLPADAAKPQPSKTLLTGVCSGSSRASFDKVGLYRSPEEFVAAANKVRHPMDTQNPLAKVTSDVLETIFCQEPRFVRLKRKTNLLKAQLLAKRLAPQERALRDSWSDGMKKVLGSKNLILWETLLRQEGYDDLEVIHLMKRGVPLVGTPDTPSCYEAKLTPATITEAQLRDSAKWRRKALASKPLAMSDDCFGPLEEACQEELDKGSLEGPFHSEEEVTQFLGHDRWCCIRRFIIQQGDKYRPIDDCCECQLNEGYSSTFKLRLQDADYFACLAMSVCRRVVSNPSRLDLKEWSGKCLDLSRAYKQLAILPAHVDLAVCMTHTKDGKPVYYVPNSLMFGSNAAVYAFNRVSRSIHFLLSRLLILPMSCFYDDFPILVPTGEADEVDGMISDLLDILGWEHKRTGEGHKGLPFAKQVDILGMRVDLIVRCF